MKENYEQDLAYVHHVGFDFFAKGAAPYIIDKVNRIGNGGRQVVDLGCGSGVLAKELTRAGLDVVGFDQSPAMIKIAKKLAPKARFVCDSFLDAEIPDCDVITSTGECLNYLFDGRVSRHSLRKLFRRVYASLTPGGLFLFDVAEPGRAVEPLARPIEGKDWAILLTVDENKKTSVLTRRIVTFRKVGQLYRRTVETHRLKLHRGVDLAADLRSIGFRVRLVRRYGEMVLRPGHVGVIARKPR